MIRRGIRSGLALSLVLGVSAGLMACGSKNHALDVDASTIADSSTTGGPGGGGIDGRVGPDAHSIDADLSICDLAKPQCANGCDDDNDGYIDGDDPECTGNLDNLEGSFATGISGDNIDTVKQDCFFDGNSGAGDDHCDIHVCCILTGDPTCAQTYNNPPFDPGSCTVTQACLDSCKPLVPPGCDCFSCCTLCDGDGCVDVFANPAIAPNCDQDAIHDSNKCPTCTKVAACSQPCGGSSCVLCPGQDPSTLPTSCGGTSTCPGGLNQCTSSTDCGPSQYCANNCCIAIVN